MSYEGTCPWLMHSTAPESIPAEELLKIRADAWLTPEITLTDNFDGYKLDGMLETQVDVKQCRDSY